MTADYEGLHSIDNTDKSDRLADFVFVHGVGGGSHSMWQYGKEESPGGAGLLSDLETEASLCAASVSHPTWVLTS